MIWEYLNYFPQIWASDNTDALCRTGIQNSYSYGYPLSVFTAHVSSCPNHQTLRITPLETRFQVASFGILGYECNLKDLSGSELNAIREQIALYKKMAGCFPVWNLLPWSRKRGFRLGNLILDLRVPGWQKSSGAVLPAPDSSEPIP